MGYGLLADVIALAHLLFVLFVMFGALFALRWPGAIWVHAPALIWGLIVEFAGLVCPLTPLESRLRLFAGESGYKEDFLSQWLFPVLYPDFLTRDFQFFLGGSLLFMNIGLYAYVLRQRRIADQRSGRTGLLRGSDDC
jgi:uncharacterized protein DUF2784